MLRLLRLLLRDPKKAAREDFEVSLETYESMIGESCPICKRSLKGHAYYGFSSAIAGTEDDLRLSDLSRLIAAGDWIAASLVKEWSPTEDAIVYSFLKCTNGEVAVFKMVDVAEFYIDGESVHVTNVSQGDRAVVEEIVQGQWAMIPSE